MIKVPSKKKLTFELEDGVCVEMRRPTNAEQTDYTETYENAKGAKQKRNAFRSFFALLGMKEEIFDSLEEGQLSFIAIELTDTSKKN